MDSTTDVAASVELHLLPAWLSTPPKQYFRLWEAKYDFCRKETGSEQEGTGS